MYVSPASAEEVAAVLALANERRLSVGPAGGSTERSAAELRTDILLHLNRLTQVEHYDHADLTVGRRCGNDGGAVECDGRRGPTDVCRAILRCRNAARLGGLLATASHGPLRHGYGAVRDYLHRSSVCDR